MRVRVRARREDYRYFHIPFFRFLLSPLPSVEKKRHVGFNKTTRRWKKNDPSVTTKRPVTFLKRPVGFNKTTRQFQQNDPSVSQKTFLQLNEHLIDGAPQSFVIKMQNTNYFLSHSRAYARITGVLSFLLSQVSHFSLKTLKFNRLPLYFKIYFIFSSTDLGLSLSKRIRNPLSFLLRCDTCDSKKTKLLLEGVRTCAYTRTHEKTQTYARNIRCA